jgi:putative cardiolipin synthase
MMAAGIRNLLALVLLALLGACAAPQPANLPPEYELPVAQSAFWEEIAGARSGDWFYLLNAGDEALRMRLQMIDSAQESIDLETFLWKPDKTGQRIQAHLLAAADRGVRVRFLLDDSFTMHEDLALHGLDDHPNISLRIYNPFRHRSDNALFRQLFNIGEFNRVNHRMHNKLLVVDGRAALVGGRNLADEYFGNHDELNFRDMEVITMGESVPATTQHFDAFWNSGWAFPLNDIMPEPANAQSLDKLRANLAGSVGVPVVASRAELVAGWAKEAQAAYAGTATFFYDQPASLDPASPDEMPDQLADELQQLIDMAENEVILVSAYLVPTPALEDVVERAEARGVNVRILTNSLKSNNHLAAHAAYRGHITQLVDNGADLHEVRVTAADRDLYMQQPIDEKGLGLHAKLLLIDDHLAFIGSCNLDPRSLKINTEVGLVIDSVELNQSLRKHLEIDFHPRNAWAVKRSDEGQLVWVGEENEVHTSFPDASNIERLEDWFIGLLPIDGEM